MLYAPIAERPDFPPAKSSVYAYPYNKGGLNNQKLALMGLFLRAFATRPAAIALPYIYLWDQRIPVNGGWTGLAQLADIYELAPLIELAGAIGVGLSAECGGDPAASWDYFKAACSHLAELATAALEAGRRNLPDGICCDFARALVPKIRAWEPFQRLMAKVFEVEGIRIVAQLRIEADWAAHSEKTLKRVLGDAEDYAPQFLRILQKINNTFPQEKQVYAVCDERSMPAAKEEIRATVKNITGIELIWKSDMMPGILSELNALDLSMMDQEMAKSSEIFVGLTNSTFSNMVTFEKFSTAGANIDTHYVYNVNGGRVVRRTDDGMLVNAFQATQPRAGNARLPEPISEKQGPRKASASFCEQKEAKKLL